MQEERRRFLERAGGIVAGGSLIGLAGCSSLEGFIGGGSGGQLSYGGSVSGELSQSDPQGHRGYYDEITFQASSGDIVTINMESQSGDTFLMLENPDGQRVASNDDITFGENLNSRIGQYPLQSSGEYTIIATSYLESGTFPYTVSLEKVGETSVTGGGNGGGGGSGLSYGQTVQGQLTTGDPTSTSYRGYYDVYEFQGSTGDVVTITMQSEAGDTYLMLENPNGVVVTENDDGGTTGFLNSRIDGYELGSSGTYRIIATSYTDSDTFAYQLSLSSGF